MHNNLAIFASGNGTNAENIIHYFHAHRGKSDTSVVVVISNNSDAYVLERAQRLDVRSEVFSKEELTKRPQKLLQLLESLGVTHIILAGYLLLIPQEVLNAYKDKIVNIHPALLPKYGGKGMYGHHVHEAVVKNREPQTGITIHLANEKYDDGDVLFQADVEVLPTDDAENVAKKISVLEQNYFPKVIDAWLSGELQEHRLDHNPQEE